MKVVSSTFIVFLILVHAIGTHAQSTGTEVTPKESAEVIAFARRFQKRFIQTKDVRPLINEFFVPSFRRRFARYHSDEALSLIKSDQPLPKSNAKVFRFYLVQTNWMFLFGLNAGSDSDYASNDNDEDIVKSLPTDLKREIERNPIVWKAMMGGQDDDAGANNPKLFDDELRFLERTVPMLRRWAVRIDAGHSESWRKHTAKMAKLYENYKVWKDECSDKDCFGFAKKTRVYAIAIDPFLCMSLIRVGGHLKITELKFCSPD